MYIVKNAKSIKSFNISLVLIQCTLKTTIQIHCCNGTARSQFDWIKNAFKIFTSWHREQELYT